MAHPAGIETFENLGPLESIRDVLEHAEERIQKEVLKHNIHWLGSFRSRLAEVYGYVYLAEDMGEVTEDEAKSAKDKLDELEVRVQELRREFETENKLLPVLIQQELIHELDVFHLTALTAY